MRACSGAILDSTENVKEAFFSLLFPGVTVKKMPLPPYLACLGRVIKFWPGRLWNKPNAWANPTMKSHISCCLFAMLLSSAVISELKAQPGPGFALRFDGSGNYVAVPHTAALNALPLTVMAWVKASAGGDLVNKYVS